MGYSDDMTTFPGLQQMESGRYRLRRVVPPELRGIIGSKNKTVTLKTHDRREAVRLAGLKWAELEAEFERARAQLRAAGTTATQRMLSDADINRIAGYVSHAVLAEDEELRLFGLGKRIDGAEEAADWHLARASGGSGHGGLQQRSRHCRRGAG